MLLEIIHWVGVHWGGFVMYLPNQGIPPTTLLVLFKSFQWLVRVHWGGFGMFKPMLQKLLNVENYWFKKLNQIKTNQFKEFRVCFWCGKVHNEYDFIDVIL